MEWLIKERIKSEQMTNDSIFEDRDRRILIFYFIIDLNFCCKERLDMTNSAFLGKNLQSMTITERMFSKFRSIFLVETSSRL